MSRALQMLWTYRLTAIAYAALLAGTWILWGLGALLVALSAIVALENVIRGPLDHGPEWGEHWRSLSQAKFWVRTVYLEERRDAERAKAKERA